MLARAFAIALCLASAPLPAFAIDPVEATEQAATMSTRELMQATALDQIFTTFADTIASSPELQGVPMPPPFLAAWKDTAHDALDADREARPDPVGKADHRGSGRAGLDRVGPEAGADRQPAGPGPGAIGVVTHQRLHDEPGDGPGEPEQRHVVEAGAQILEDARGIGLGQRKPELDAEGSHAEKADLPEAER